MGVDPEVLRGLEVAVVGDPDNVALRLHLAGLLLDDGQAAAALGHCEAVLRADPTSTAATELADRSRAAFATGPGSGGREAEAVRIAGGVSDEMLFDIVRPEVTLADVAGMDAVKARLSASFLEPLRNEELRALYQTELRGGMLLFGPPGCGKTHLARAIAGELGVFFVSVGIPDVLDMWVGNSEKNLHGLFETARATAPTVVFIDELDALGHKRSRFRADSAGRNVVNQLLAELDGIDADNDGVFLVGATNRPWDVDPALRRPGRFDRTLVVLPPDRAARAAILTASLAGRPCGSLDLERIALATALYSGADLVHLCDTAAQAALADSVASGRTRLIEQSDLDTALAEVRPSTIEWLREAKAYAEFSDDTAAYGDLLAFSREHRI